MIRDIEAALKYAELQLMLSTNDTKTRCFKTIISALRAELSRQENAPLTWNERINQMTLEEKAIWLYNMDVCRVSSISIEECNSFRHCVECMKSMLASPYTEGATK